MALVPHKITALAESDAQGTGGKNIIAGAVVSLYDSDGNAATLYDNEEGGNGSTAKQTDLSGQVVVFVEPGEYSEEVNGSERRKVLIGNKSITTEQLILRQKKSELGDTVDTSGFYAPGDSGGAQWKATSTTGLTPSQSPSDRGAAELVDGSGRLWDLIDLMEVNPESVGYLVGVNSTVNTSAFEAAVQSAKGVGGIVKIPSGVNFLTRQINLDDRVSIIGSSRHDCQLVFTGNPVKTIQTYKIWRGSYNAGDFSSSSDAPIAAGFKVTGAQVAIKNVRITGDYSQPNSSATPLAGYPVSYSFDAGVLQQVTDFSMEDVTIEGGWSLGALYIDASIPSGNTSNDRGYYKNCKFYGKYGLRIEGAYGEPISGDNFEDLTASDTRGAGGASDLGFYNCQFYDEHIKINTDQGDRYVRDSGGAVMIHGQVSANSSKRIQGIRFFNCRAASVKDENILNLNYCNRVEFHGLHTEKAADASFSSDGLSLLSVSDFRIKSTTNSENIKFIGGEKSGERDEITYSNGSETLVSMLAFDDATLGSQTLISNNIKDQGAWTPVVAGASVAGSQTYSNATGRYVRTGNVVFAHCRISLTSFDPSTIGNIRITGLPYPAKSGTGNETSGSVGFYSSIVLGGGYTQLMCAIDDGKDYIDLWKGGSDIGVSQINHTAMKNNTGLFLSITYETDAPTGV